MTEDLPVTDRPMRASEKLAAILGLPPPRPLTAEERAAYEAKLSDGDAQVAAIRAGRTQQSR